MDLRAIINHDSNAPPPATKSQTHSPAQAPNPPPPVPPKREKKEKSLVKPIWAQTWTSDWHKKKGLQPGQAPPFEQSTTPQATNGVHRNTPSPLSNFGSGLTPDRRPRPLWEVNIVDRVPLDQISKIIADFLFTNVVSASDLGPDAKWEVEAKLGRLIDQNTNDRIRLPIQNDCILDKADPNVRVSFKSSMTELQHRAFNEFLNDALMKSLPPKTGPPPQIPRVPLSYEHTRQIDTFYDLTQKASGRLPPAALGLIGAINRARVRVTTDQKTGAELAKIIKVRRADLDVHSPYTLFDWRVSINAEIDYSGPVEELTRHAERGVPTPSRNKDRMTYKHQAYQVDLTQVTAPGPQPIKEHELEVEIDKMDDLRKQGALLLAGQENTYERMVRGFVDNVRLLQRQLPFDHP